MTSDSNYSLIMYLTGDPEWVLHIDAICGWNVFRFCNHLYSFFYMQGCYEKVKQHGGLTLSDEVQTGFGRLGSHFWGFESMEVRINLIFSGV